MNIAFSPPDISELEINEIVATLKSGWITTGPKTKLFEQKIAQYCGTDKAVCLNSATAAMEMTLHMLGIGPGDEVITSAYTYTASASVIHHTGAKIVLVDTALDSYEMDYNLIVLSLYANGSSRATAIGVFNPEWHRQCRRQCQRILAAEPLREDRCRCRQELASVSSLNTDAGRYHDMEDRTEEVIDSVGRQT